MYGVNGYLIAKEGKRDELLSYLLEAAAAMEELAGCLIYSVGIDPEDESRVYVYEVWQDEAAHKQSLTLEVFNRLIEKAKPIMDGMGDYPALTILGGKGID